MGVALPGIIATTPPEAGFLASSAFFGMFIGAIGISMLADRIGRKRALILAILGYSLFSAAAAFVQDYTSLVVVRIVEGLGLGAEVPLVYTFVSELVPVRRRGLLLTGSAFFWQGSNLVAALVAIVVIPWLSWRGMFVVGALPAVLILPLWWRLPESPRYLIHNGRIAEADALVLSRVRIWSAFSVGWRPGLRETGLAFDFQRWPLRVAEALFGLPTRAWEHGSAGFSKAPSSKG
jgi:MFS transporter, putative metabolite:H+ symporter